MLIVGGTNSSGTSWTCSVAGRYWISSNTSVRSTTDPGVTARFPPTSNLLTSTLAGRCGERVTSSQEPPAAADEVGAARVDALLEHGGIGPGEVGRRQCVEHVARGKPRLALGPPIELGIRDQPVDGVTGGQVALHHAVKEPVVLPRPVAKPAIALGADERRSARPPRARAPRQSRPHPRGTARMARQSRDRSDRRPVASGTCPRHRLRARRR